MVEYNRRLARSAILSAFGTRIDDGFLAAASSNAKAKAKAPSGGAKDTRRSTSASQDALRAKHALSVIEEDKNGPPGAADAKAAEEEEEEVEEEAQVAQTRQPRHARDEDETEEEDEKVAGVIKRQAQRNLEAESTGADHSESNPEPDASKSKSREEEKDHDTSDLSGRLESSDASEES